MCLLHELMIVTPVWFCLACEVVVVQIKLLQLAETTQPLGDGTCT